MPIKLSIIILNYNVTALLRACIASVQRNVVGVSYEIIVIDNHSPDDSWKVLKTEFSEVTFIEEPKNKGFAFANNKAVKQAQGEYILLLNPDTELLDNQMQSIISFADEQKCFGCLGVRMVDAAGNFLPESKRAVPDMFNSFEKLFTNFRTNSSKSYYRNDIDEKAIQPVEVITGAFFLCKRKVYEEIGGLDEAYFMYGEDIDICYTLQQKGLQNWYYGQMTILHHKGESTTKDAVYLQRFYGAMQTFIDKYYRKQKPLQHLLLSFGLNLKHFLERLKLK